VSVLKEKKRVEYVSDDGSYVVKKSKKSNIFAFILCVIIAFIIWLYAVSVETNEQKKANANLNSGAVNVETTEAA
jgi:hypothetical protein